MVLKLVILLLLSLKTFNCQFNIPISPNIGNVQQSQRQLSQSDQRAEAFAQKLRQDAVEFARQITATMERYRQKIELQIVDIWQQWQNSLTVVNTDIVTTSQQCSNSFSILAAEVAKSLSELYTRLVNLEQNINRNNTIPDGGSFSIGAN